MTSKKAQIIIDLNDKTGKVNVTGQNVSKVNLIEGVLILVKAIVKQDPTAGSLQTVLDAIARDRIILHNLAKKASAKQSVKKQTKTTKKVVKKVTKKVAKRK